MAEATLKRQREDEEEQLPLETVKRQRSYEDILSILDEDEEEPTQDLSSLITTLQQEISSNEDLSLRNEEIQMSSCSSETDLSEIHPSIEEDSERVMKHLLEASDDELGIPNTVIDDFDGSQGIVSVEEIDCGDLLLQPIDGFGDGFLWEIEDEAANYYALMQSELFM